MLLFTTYISDNLFLLARRFTVHWSNSQSNHLYFVVNFLFLFSISGITSFFDSQGNIKDYFKIKMSILNVLLEVGMTPSLPKIFLPGPPEALTVLLDGCVVGCIASSEVEKVVAHIRELKVSSVAVVCFVKISLLPL